MLRGATRWGSELFRALQNAGGSVGIYATASVLALSCSGLGRLLERVGRCDEDAHIDGFVGDDFDGRGSVLGLGRQPELAPGLVAFGVTRGVAIGQRSGEAPI